MWTFICTIGLLGVIICIIGTLAMVLKKKPIWKKWAIALLISFVLMCVGGYNTPVSPEITRQENLLFQAKDLITDGKYSDALEIAEKADKAYSDSDSQDMIEQCKALITSQQFYEKGISALKANQLLEAYIDFSKVSKSDTINYDPAMQKAKELTPQIYQQAKSLYNSNKSEESLKIVKQILNVQPDYDPAKELKVSCQNAINEQKNIEKAINIVAKLSDYKGDTKNLYASQIKDNIYEVTFSADLGSGVLTTLNRHLVDIKKSKVIASLQNGDKTNLDYENTRAKYSGESTSEPTDAKTSESPQQFMAKCQWIDYPDLLRNTEKYNGTPVTYTGYVNQVMESKSLLGKIRMDLLLNISNDQYTQHLVYIKYSISKGDQRILAGDTIQIWGVVNGRKNLTMTTGVDQMFPAIDLKYYNLLSVAE